MSFEDPNPSPQEWIRIKYTPIVEAAIAYLESSPDDLDAAGKEFLRRYENDFNIKIPPTLKLPEDISENVRKIRRIMINISHNGREDLSPEQRAEIVDYLRNSIQ